MGRTAATSSFLATFALRTLRFFFLCHVSWTQRHFILLRRLRVVRYRLHDRCPNHYRSEKVTQDWASCLLVPAALVVMLFMYSLWLAALYDLKIGLSRAVGSSLTLQRLLLGMPMRLWGLEPGL